jgi:ribonuclease P protein component
MRQRFHKEERLKSSKVIERLFSHGNSFLVHPFKVNWLEDDKKGRYPARVLIGVSSKNFKKAVDRNHLKRLSREAYRKNKYFIYEYLEDRGIACNFSLIYIGKKQEEYSVIEKKIITLLKRLISELEQYSDQKATSS